MRVTDIKSQGTKDATEDAHPMSIIILHVTTTRRLGKCKLFDSAKWK